MAAQGVLRGALGVVKDHNGQYAGDCDFKRTRTLPRLASISLLVSAGLLAFLSRSLEYPKSHAKEGLTREFLRDCLVLQTPKRMQLSTCDTVENVFFAAHTDEESPDTPTYGSEKRFGSVGASGNCTVTACT
jgi:hypothetical protein